MGLAEATQELAVMHAITTQLVQAPAESPRVTAEQLLRLSWVDAACVALPDAEGRLMVAAERGFGAGAAAATLDVVQRDLPASTAATGAFVEDADRDGATRPLVAYGVRALAAAPMQTPRGIAGMVVVAAAQRTEFPAQRRSLLRAICKIGRASCRERV